MCPGGTACGDRGNCVDVRVLRGGGVLEWGGYLVHSESDVDRFLRGIAFDDEFLRTTWAGLALMVVFYGLIGAIWGCIWKGDRKRLLAFYGALTGLAVYFVSFHYIWPRMNPLLPLHEPVRQLEVAHILWGAALSRSPGYVRKILAALAPPVVFEAAATPHVVAYDVAVHDVVDGEAPARNIRQCNIRQCNIRQCDIRQCNIRPRVRMPGRA